MSRDTFFESGGGFLKVSKFTKDVILLLKFAKPSSADSFFIPLCYLFIFLSSNNSKYSLGLTANVNIQGLSVCSTS